MIFSGIYNVNLKTKGHIGIKRKMLYQAKAFSEACGAFYLYCADGSDIVEIFLDSGLEKSRKVIFKNFGVGDFFKCLLGKLDQVIDSDAYYIRYYPMKNSDLSNLSKALSSKGKVFIELYTKEYRNELSIEDRLLDEKYFDFLYESVSAFFTIGEMLEGEKKNGIPLLKISNGIDVDLECIPKINTPEVVLDFKCIGIGNISIWHGYDIFLKSMYDFKKSDFSKRYNVTFDIYGSGDQIENLKNLVDSYGLNDQVFFKGIVSSDSLSEIYSEYHLGVGTLAAYKTGIKYCEPLKHREYMLYGLPFLYGQRDSFNIEGALCLEQPNFSINIEDLIKWREGLHPEEKIKVMQDYCINNLTWLSSIRSVVDLMKGIDSTRGKDE